MQNGLCIATGATSKTGDEMKYRRLSPTGDYMFGFGNTSFATDLEACAQAIKTKLKMFQGEYWEDLDEGLPFFQQMAGSRNKTMIDALIRSRILETPGVTSIQSFSSEISADRKYTATALVNTEYGETEVTV